MNAGSANLQLVPCTHQTRSQVQGAGFHSPLPARGLLASGNRGSSLDHPTPTQGLNVVYSWEYPGSQGKTKESQRIRPKEAWRCLAPLEQRPQEGQRRVCLLGHGDNTNLSPLGGGQTVGSG